MYKKNDLISAIKTSDAFSEKLIKTRIYPSKAAVMLTLLEKDGGFEVLFEVRSENMGIQPCDVGFPGGHVDKGERAGEAIIRELKEELLLKDAENQVEIIKTLPLVMGPKGIIVTPFIGILKDYDGNFSKAETDHIFTAPLSFFLENDPEKYTTIINRTAPDNFPFDSINNGENFNKQIIEDNMYFYRYKDYVIWGLTAKITYMVSIMIKEAIF